ncbi:hypothetical protein Pdw03_8067 [Penicillium digitatum]|uniref:MADS-box domain-containing protein n=1 Tax=Penicillium digitatum TaxID=36651 RepID=A0A7T7BLQ8_PENDI|nr:hypothetical protein Pdw03_8067 [Penicillium digitatum]
MGGPDPNRLVRKQLRQRTSTLKSKARDLAKLCKADVYLVICSSRERYVYNSSGSSSWPPPDDDLQNLYPDLIRDPPAPEHPWISEPHPYGSRISPESEISTPSTENDSQLDLILDYFADRRRLLGEALAVEKQLQKLPA